MAFTFLHTADWQIGKTFGGFEADKASLLRRARLGAIDRLAAVAGEVGAADVVVCGDVFDSEGLSDRQLREALQRLATHQRLNWHLLPGNHDPARADGIWSRLAGLGLPGNVRPLLEARPVAIAEGVCLLPAPLATKAVSRDPTSWMDAAATTAGVLRIGVAHGSTQGFGSSGSASVGIDPGRRQSAGLDYLALGDWHGVREVGPGVWYSGTPEPDQFPDNEPGYALAVTIERAGAAPRVTRIATAAHQWRKATLVLRGRDDLADVEAGVAALGPAKSALLLELTLKGRITLADDAEIEAALATLEAGIFHLVVRRDDLALAGDDDGAALGDPRLQRVAARLQAMRQGGREVSKEAPGEAPEQAALAEGALRRLYGLARQLGGARS